MSNKTLILGMMLVTMLPRIIPFYAFKTEDLPPFIRAFLNYIPYTVLGALILPGGLNGIEGKPLISGICLAMAALITWIKGGIIGPVIGAVSVGLIMIYIGL